MDRVHAVTHEEANAHRFHAGLQGTGNLRVQAADQAVAFLDDRDPDTQRGEDAGVLAADHAAANNQHGLGDFVQGKDRVRIIDARVVERESRRPVGIGARRQQNDLRLNRECGAAFRLDPDGMRIHKRCAAGVQGHIVPFEVVQNPRPFGFLYHTFAHQKIANGHTRFQTAEIQTEQLPLPKPCQEKRCLPKRLGRHRSRVGRRAAQEHHFLNEGDFFSEVSCLRCTLLARWPGSNDNQIIFFGGHGSSLMLDRGSFRQTGFTPARSSSNIRLVGCQ